jgi:hypothetical protein
MGHCTLTETIGNCEISFPASFVSFGEGESFVRFVAVLDAQGYLQMARAETMDEEVEEGTVRRISPWVRMVPGTSGKTEAENIAQTLTDLWFSEEVAEAAPKDVTANCGSRPVKITLPPDLD